jgi:hypothetical protein
MPIPRHTRYHPIALKRILRYATVRWMRARTVASSALYFSAMDKAAMMLRLQGVA